MILNDLIQELEILAPAEYAMSWDNSGLLVGHRGAQISSVYITLDASGESVEQAVKEGYQFGCFGDAMLILDD